MAEEDNTPLGFDEAGKRNCCYEYCDNCGKHCCQKFWSKWYGDATTETIAEPRWGSMTVKQLLIFRICVIAFGIFTIIFDWIIQYEPEYYFCYYTNWAWWALTGYFICAVIITRRYQKNGASDPLTCFEKFTVVFFPIAWSLALTVCILYWALIFDEDELVFPYFVLMIFVHALNIALITADLFMNRIRFQWIQAPIMSVIGIVYLTVNFGCSNGNEGNVYGDTLVFYPIENVTGDSFGVAGQGLALTQISFFVGFFLIWARDKCAKAAKE
mmetsp:Transcript_17413/g.22178  ORF Transcript_17413/g.22178 Transcript_17413/m.22178 type:complete len:271 (+) Transcript_17413:167-979(+)|eukprot:CAMPEP_0204866130 /NCGR_PEP_ID=MMETSP1348-20121228/16006_1 /ASSEMBLY_ACC=CAM_ASM_000700 /TAXON_ID=215587 /ORGANISM="Aplanochytrium stocchinoi, Strain GSBS06" /LENGTH=270 /DNA_ID=CAMNT_0052017861 /DNA_START=118 /DNA_END=930 /DNA_ORIENTATION=+